MPFSQQNGHGWNSGAVSRSRVSGPLGLGLISDLSHPYIFRSLLPLPLFSAVSDEHVSEQREVSIPITNGSLERVPSGVLTSCLPPTRRLGKKKKKKKKKPLQQRLYPLDGEGLEWLTYIHFHVAHSPQTAASSPLDIWIRETQAPRPR